MSSVWSGESWAELERLGEKWWKGLIIKLNEWVLIATCKQLVWSTRIGRNMPIWILTYLIITINDTSIGDLPLIITISDTCKNQPKRLDNDNTINLSSLIVSLDLTTVWNCKSPTIVDKSRFNIRNGVFQHLPSIVVFSTFKLSFWTLRTFSEQPLPHCIIP